MRTAMLWLLTLGACAVPDANRDWGAPETEASPVATLDDVTIGLQENAAEAARLRGFATKDKLAEPGGGGEAVEPTPTGERMLVYHGAMNVEVARVDEAAQAFLAQVQQWGGYLSRQQDQQYTVRLPAAKFDDAMAALRAMGRVLSESRQANDVTEEFVDLGIRLDNARRARERLLELLAKADKVEDILKVEEQLRRLTEEVERMEGRRKFLADQVAMATLSAAFTAVGPAPDKPGGRPSRFPWIRAVGAERVLGRW